LSIAYARNRIRIALEGSDDLIAALCELSESCAALRKWVAAAALRLEDSFPAGRLAGAPAILADEAARCWLARRGMPPDQIQPGTIANLIEMASDAASAPRRDFPGGLRVRRRRGMISEV